MENVFWSAKVRVAKEVEKIKSNCHKNEVDVPEQIRDIKVINSAHMGHFHAVNN